MAATVRRIVVVAVVVIVMAEVLVRIGSSRIPEPLVWYHAVAQVKVEQMDQLRDDGPPVAYVLAGTSQMAEGADPVLFSSLVDGRPVTYNAAVLAGYPHVNVRFLPEEVVPRLQPTTIVYGVSFTDLMRDKEPPYDTSPATDPSVFGALDRFASRYSSLIRYRRELRDPLIWGSLLTGGQGGQVEFYRQDVIGPWGAWKLTDDRVCSEGQRPADRPVVPARFEPDPSRVEAFWGTVDRLERDGIQVIIAVMPYADCHDRAFHARDANAEARRQLATRAALVGVPVIDLTDEIHDDSLFVDSGHLNRTGKQRFTEMLAAAVNRLPPAG